MKPEESESYKEYLRLAGQENKITDRRLLDIVTNIPEVTTSKYINRGHDVYKMERIPRGPCLIINNMKFKDAPKMNRLGSIFNALQLEHVFKKMHFEVTLKNDLTAEDMLYWVKKIATKKMECDAVVIIILSHGKQGCALGTDCLPLEYDKIMEVFNNQNCKHLKGKPKLCFVQACQGGLRSVQVSESSGSSQSDDSDNIPLLPEVGYPKTSDILFSFAAQEGYQTMKYKKVVGYYATHLANVLAKHAHNMHLLDMLLLVETNTRKSPTIKRFYKNYEIKLSLSTSFKGLGWSKKLYFNPTPQGCEDIKIAVCPSNISLCDVMNEEKNGLSEFIECLQIMDTEDDSDLMPSPSPQSREEACSSTDIKNNDQVTEIINKALLNEISHKQPSDLAFTVPAVPDQRTGGKLWVIGGGQHPELLSEDGTRWLVQSDSGLDPIHMPITNSSKPVLVFDLYNISKWDPEKKSLKKVKSLCSHSDFAHAYLNKTIYLFGGFEGRTENTTCKIFNIYESNAANMDKPWNTNEQLKLSGPTINTPAVVFQGKIYLLFGINCPMQVKCMDSGHQVESSNSTNTNKENNDYCRTGYALAACKDYIWVFGGRIGEHCLTDVDRYCPGTLEWKRKRPMRTARMNFSVTYFNKRFYATGGTNMVHGARPLNICEVYNPRTDEWEDGPNLNIPRKGHGSVALPIEKVTRKRNLEGKTTSSKVAKEEAYEDPLN